ncbi:MAG TPA: hypothetical protein VFL91_15785 [Thermomicrobiales bacterium]|nr:hypothetical protein [Thermomicrobiales bacterium]
MDNEGRRRPADILRGLIPWIPLPLAAQRARPLILHGEEITSILPYDRPTDFLAFVRLLPDGRTAEGIHIVDATRCQGHRFGTPLMPGSVLGDVLYLTFGVLLRHSPLMPADLLEGKIGVRARDEEFRYRRRVEPGTEVTMHVELLGRRGDLLAAHGWATAHGETVFDARRCWIGLLTPEEGARQPGARP